LTANSAVNTLSVNNNSLASLAPKILGNNNVLVPSGVYEESINGV
jgi:hypothetical protein